MHLLQLLTPYITVILCCASIAAIPNYLAYSHIKQYRHYKQVRTIPVRHFIWGFIIGLPLLLIPFVINERDQGFNKYQKVKRSILFARIFTFLFYLSVLITLIFFYLRISK